MIPKPRLLITRFAPHANLLADALNDAGYYSIAQPLLSTTATKGLIDFNQLVSCHYDFIIAVSGNAVKYTAQQLNGHWPDSTYIAVGSSTQEYLARESKQAVLCPKQRFDSEGLLELDILQSINDKRVLILRGEGGRDLIEDTLVSRGAKVDFFQTYKRIEIDLDGEKLVNFWQQAAINGAIISSIEILNQLFMLVPKEYKQWLFELTLYVPSQRVADKAFILGAKHIVLLPSLGTDKIVTFFEINNGHCS